MAIANKLGPKTTGKFIFAWVLALFVTACSSVPPLHISLTEDPTFPKDQVMETFASVYEIVTAKALDEVSVEELAVANMEGLAKLDQKFEIENDREAISIVYNNHRLDRFMKPAEDKVEEWTEITTEATALARRASPEIAQKEIDEIYAAMLGQMLGSIDEYSRYAQPGKARMNRDRRHGYGGIGIVIAKTDEGLSISEIFPEGPAHKAGLKTGDILTHVDEKSTNDLAPHDIAKLIRGPISTQVSIRVSRKGIDSEIGFEIEREKVIRPTVKTVEENGIITLTVSGFNRNTTRSLAKSVRTALTKTANPPKGFILDLRNNPGGLLKQSVRISDLFVAGGRLVGAKGRHPQANRSYRANDTDIAQGLPIVVVVDGKSASASEIVAATLQDRGRAVVVGTNSYGKGTVQTISQLPNKGEITLTWSRLLLPSGYFYHKLGVHPALCTSGLSSPDSSLITSTLSHGDEFTTTINQWRQVDPKDLKTRAQLRTRCPAEKRDGDIELKLAKKIIENGFLYESLLSLDHMGQALLH